MVIVGLRDVELNVAHVVVIGDLREGDLDLHPLALLELAKRTAPAALAVGHMQPQSGRIPGQGIARGLGVDPEVEVVPAAPVAQRALGNGATEARPSDGILRLARGVVDRNAPAQRRRGGLHALGRSLHGAFRGSPLLCCFASEQGSLLLRIRGRRRIGRARGRET